MTLNFMSELYTESEITEAVDLNNQIEDGFAALDMLEIRKNRDLDRIDALVYSESVTTEELGEKYDAVMEGFGEKIGNVFSTIFEAIGKILSSIGNIFRKNVSTNLNNMGDDDTVNVKAGTAADAQKLANAANDAANGLNAFINGKTITGGLLGTAIAVAGGVGLRTLIKHKKTSDSDEQSGGEETVKKSILERIAENLETAHKRLEGALEKAKSYKFKKKDDKSEEANTENQGNSSGGNAEPAKTDAKQGNNATQDNTSGGNGNTGSAQPTTLSDEQKKAYQAYLDRKKELSEKFNSKQITNIEFEGEVKKAAKELKKHGVGKDGRLLTATESDMSLFRGYLMTEAEEASEGEETESGIMAKILKGGETGFKAFLSIIKNLALYVKDLAFYIGSVIGRTFQKDESEEKEPENKDNKEETSSNEDQNAEGETNDEGKPANESATDFDADEFFSIIESL